MRVEYWQCDHCGKTDKESPMDISVNSQKMPKENKGLFFHREESFGIWTFCDVKCLLRFIMSDKTGYVKNITEQDNE